MSIDFSKCMLASLHGLALERQGRPTHASRVAQDDHHREPRHDRHSGDHDSGNEGAGCPHRRILGALHALPSRPKSYRPMARPPLSEAQIPALAQEAGWARLRF
jgi:hypothetical protein